MSGGIIEILADGGSASPGTPALDIVFVHGLGGDKLTTWQADPDSFWPRWLSEMFPSCRVSSFGYDSQKLAGFLTGGGASLHDIALALADSLTNREVVAPRVLFVCHSLGGLVVKQMLRRCSDSIVPEYKELGQSIVGIAFLGTPHQGATFASSVDHLLRRFLSKQTQQLVYGEDNLVDLNDFFRSRVIIQNIQVRVYYETEKFGGVLIVDKVTANPGVLGCEPVAVQSDHMMLCKPKDRASPVFRSICGLIRKILKISAPYPSGGGDGKNGEAGEAEHASIVNNTVQVPLSLGVFEIKDISLNQIASRNALIKAAKRELDVQGRMSNAVADALIESDIDSAELNQFLRIYAGKTSDITLYCIAITAADLAMKRGIGFDTVEYCLSCGRLGDKWSELTVIHMVRERKDANYALLAHRLISMDSYKRFADPHYYSFLQRFGSSIAQHDETLIVAYLLHPIRGPGNLLIDAFEVAIEIVKQPNPLVARWIEWISDGFFDNQRSLRCECPEVLYKKISRCHPLRPNIYGSIAENANHHIINLFRNGAFEECLLHLNSMAFAEYALAGAVARDVLPRIETRNVDANMSLKLNLAKEAIYALAALQVDPSDQRRFQFQNYVSLIYDMS